MQVFGLQRALYRGARWSSRCETARIDEATTLRADAVRRWRETRRRALGGCGGAGGRRVARLPLSLGTPPRA